MSLPFSMIGRIAVKPDCQEQFKVLYQLLEPMGDEIVHCQDGVLTVYLDSEDVPACYPDPARKALTDFCAECALASAVFQSDLGMLVLGPTQAAHAVSDRALAMAA